MFKDTFDPSALAQQSEHSHIPPDLPQARPNPSGTPASGSEPPTASVPEPGQAGQEDADHSSAPSAPRHENERDEEAAAAAAAASDRLSSSREAGYSGRTQDAAASAPASEWHSFGSMSEGGQSAFMRQFPLHTLSAVNTVLFGRHGYMRMREHGDPRCCCVLLAGHLHCGHGEWHAETDSELRHASADHEHGGVIGGFV